MTATLQPQPLSSRDRDYLLQEKSPPKGGLPVSKIEANGSGGAAIDITVFEEDR